MYSGVDKSRAHLHDKGAASVCGLSRIRKFRVMECEYFLVFEQEVGRGIINTRHAFARAIGCVDVFVLPGPKYSYPRTQAPY